MHIMAITSHTLTGFGRLLGSPAASSRGLTTTSYLCAHRDERYGCAWDIIVMLARTHTHTAPRTCERTGFCSAAGCCW